MYSQRFLNKVRAKCGIHTKALYSLPTTKQNTYNFYVIIYTIIILFTFYLIYYLLIYYYYNFPMFKFSCVNRG